MIYPPFLSSGDTIGIVSPAGLVNRGDIDLSVDILKRNNYNIVIGRNVYKRFNCFAGTDEERLEDLQEMLDNKNIQAILCSRGGYGCTRIIDKIEFSQFVNNPKWIIGFSDITVLHNHVNNYLGIASIHGPMAKTLRDNKSFNYLLDCISGRLKRYTIRGKKQNIPGKAKGILIGGNLSLICNITGSISDFNPDGKILFLEDTGEYLYDIDRMLYGLGRSKDLSLLKGLIIGNFSKTKDNKTSFGKTVYEIFSDYFKKYKIPICFGFPGGHNRENYPLILGSEISLMVNNKEAVINFL